MVPNRHLCAVISASAAGRSGEVGNDDHGQRTELDSHANMAVFGRGCTVVNDTGLHCNITPFSGDLPGMKMVSIKDVAVAYDDPYTLQTFLMVAKNVLHVPSMSHNLIPPFLMREALLRVNEEPKHQASFPTIEHHSIFDPETKLRIHLKLHGIFSYFLTRPLTIPEQLNWEEHPVVYLTPDAPSWDPYSEHFAEEEERYIDHDGDLIQPREISIPKNDVVTAADVSELYAEPLTWDRFDEIVDTNLADDVIDLSGPVGPGTTAQLDDGFSAEISDVSVDTPEVEPAAWVLHSEPNETNPERFADRIAQRVRDAKIAMALGSMTVSEEDELFAAVAKSISETSATLAALQAGNLRGVSAEHLSKIWRLPHDLAERTLGCTSQLIRQDANSKLSRNFVTNDRQARYRRLDSVFFSDTFFVTSKAKSSRGNIGAQLYVSDKGFVAVYPVKKEADFMDTLKLFAKEVGVPYALIVDSARTQKKLDVRRFCAQIGTTLKVLEEGTQHANRAELYIGFFKEGIRKDLRESHSPLRFWDYCAERLALIYQVSCKNLFQLNGTNPWTATFGTEADISHICQFGWYQWVYFREASADFPYPAEVLGRCLGPAKNEGNVMCQWVLKMNGQVVPRRSLRHLTPGELSPSNLVERRKRDEFDAAIRRKWGDSFTEPDVEKGKMPEFEGSNPQDGTFDLEPYEDDEESLVDFPNADLRDPEGKPLGEHNLLDTLINAEVLLPQGEAEALCKVVRRAVDSEGRQIGQANENPMLNTLVYECEFEDGTVKEYAANVIAQNIYAQSDPDGWHHRLAMKIIDHKSDGTAIPKSDKYIKSKNGQNKLRKSTVGWKLLVEWNDSSRQWVDLRLLKESNPIEVAEYAKARGIDDEAAFAWWVDFTLRKRDTIVSAVNARVRKVTHKYGIELPSTHEEAMALDKKNGNTYWRDALYKEMGNVGVAFEILKRGEKPPPGWKKSSGHIIFDIKMDFTRKARWVKDGHRTPNPENSSYAGVVSKESIRILLTHAALHDVEVLAADIRNAYLQAPSSEKHYIICGPEFGVENAGCVALIRRALYGGKAAGRDFWHHLRDCMNHIGFASSRADPDVWYRESTRTKGVRKGEKYYEYVLLYTDDCLVISDNAENVLRNEIGEHFVLKEESIGPPSQYLGGKLRQVTLDDGTKAWAFGSSQYVQAAVKNVETHLAKRNEKLVAKAPTPLSSGYRPEIDVSAELDGPEASYFHSLIGVLRWIVELGRADICVEVSMMSSHLALPRAGHMKEVLHIFAYLKKHHNAEMVFDPSMPDFDKSIFKSEDWAYSAYGCEDLQEEIPPNMPKPHGESMTMRVYVDSDHAGDQVTRRSRTGFVVFLNNAPIYWFSKKQGSCETSTFGSEFVAMKQATEYVRGLRYKLRMLGIPVEDPAFVFGDNQSVLANTSNPASTLKKKSNAICYHFVREGCAAGEWITAYINTHLNVADMFTKPLPSGEKRWSFVRRLLHHVAPTSSSGSD